MIAQYVRSPAVNPVSLSTSQFIGRQRELNLIWHQYEVAKGGSVRVVLLVGELGLGKTRLLDEVALHAAQDGATVLRGGASESEGMPPYLPFLEALGQHIRITPLDQLREQVAVAPETLASLLPELAVRLGEVPVAHPSLPEQTRLRLYEALGAFLEVISAPGGLVLMLDDLHWADSASLDLLCHIVRHHAKARLLVLGTYREGEIERNPALERAVTELVRMRVVTTVPLNPLSAGEIEALAVSYLGGPISPAVSRLLHTQSEGNPFFAEELIRSWVEVDALVQRNNQWVAIAPLEHSLPSSIVGALRQRFARLSSRIIDHLRVAAIIGRKFDLSLLATVESQEIEVVEESLLEAVRAGLVRTDQNGVFTFSHDKIRERLYAEVSASRRRHLHEIIGRVFEAQYDQKSIQSTYLLAELAFHFAHSNDRMRGARYSQLAAEHALQASATEEALAHYRIALELLDPQDMRLGKLLMRLGETALLVGEETEAVAAYEKAFRWFSQSGKAKAAARAAHGLGLAYWHQGALQGARAALEHALELLEHDVSAQAVRVLVDLATLLTAYTGQPVEGTAYAQQALEMTHHLGDNRLAAAAARANAVRLYVTTDDISSAVQSFEQTLALAEASNDLPEAALCCLYLANAYYRLAQIRRSYEVSVRRIEFSEHCRDTYQLRDAHSWLALLLASQGAWVEAERAIERAEPVVRYLSSPVPFVYLRQIRGFLAYQREDYVTAERELQAAMVNQRRDPGQLMFFAGLLGLAQAALGKREEAYAYMCELDELLADLPTGTLSAASILVCQALIAIALSNQERLANLYPRLLPFHGQHYWFLVDRVLGQMATLRRDWEAAIIHLAAAEATAQREGLRPELARVLLAQADCEEARSGSGDIQRLLKQALDLFEELDMSDAAGRIRTRLSTLTRKPRQSASPSLPASLSESEARVLKLVAQGKSNRQIAGQLGLSEKTVANHLTHIFGKTESENRAAAAAFAIRHGLA